MTRTVVATSTSSSAMPARRRAARPRVDFAGWDGRDMQMTLQAAVRPFDWPSRQTERLSGNDEDDGSDRRLGVTFLAPGARGPSRDLGRWNRRPRASEANLARCHRRDNVAVSISRAPRGRFADRVLTAGALRRGRGPRA